LTAGIYAAENRMAVLLGTYSGAIAPELTHGIALFERIDVSSQVSKNRAPRKKFLVRSLMCVAMSVASQRQISEGNFDEAVAGGELDAFMPLITFPLR
jgi:hypothetical protein